MHSSAPSSILGSVTLGYQVVWSPQRQRSGVRLCVDSERTTAVDARHLLDAILSHWPHAEREILLSPGSASLLQDCLAHLPAHSLALEVQSHWLQEPDIAQRLTHAHARGLRMVWCGAPGQTPPQAPHDLFTQTLNSLTIAQTLATLRLQYPPHSAHHPSDPAPAQTHATHGPGSPVSSPVTSPVTSPVISGALYQGLENQALLEYALDQQHISGHVGWPGEDILHRYRGQRIHPSYALLQDAIDAVDQDQTLDTVEHRLGRDPLLTYRFLRHANSAALALPQAVGSVRDALIALGYRHLRQWLQQEAQNASQDPNLEPIRASMVLRARIMENLAQVGIQEDLRRDIFLCGIFSQIDALLDQPLASALSTLPISGRITSALTSQRGPYLAWLQTASALGSGSTHAIRQACKTHQIAPQEVNRALLRALAEPAPTPRKTASNTP
jgi:hypothetical protein